MDQILLIKRERLEKNNNKFIMKYFYFFFINFLKVSRYLFDQQLSVYGQFHHKWRWMFCWVLNFDHQELGI
jgi:hypothetical protein